MDLVKLIVLILAPFVIFGGYLYFLKKHKKTKQLRYIEDYVFEVSLQETLLDKYPHLTVPQIRLTFEALRNYFITCHCAQGKPVGMPSKVVDEAWHQFILFTREYKSFCEQAFGRFLHHTPAKALKNPRSVSQSIKRSWRLSCYLEQLHPLRITGVPMLFSMDDELDIQDGFIYRAGKQHISRRQALYSAENIGCVSDCLGSTGRAPGAKTATKLRPGLPIQRLFDDD